MDRLEWMAKQLETLDISQQEDAFKFVMIEQILKGQFELSLDMALQVDRNVRGLKRLVKEEKKKYEHLLDLYEKLQDDYDMALAIKALQTSPRAIPLPKNKEASEAVAITQLSDWHVGESVAKASVNGMNEYNPKIAQRRAIKYSQNLLKVLGNSRANSLVETLIVHAGGDFINGWIHPENMETNSMSPTEETEFAYQLLMDFFQFLLDHAKLRRIIVICNVGNHGRLTSKYRYANEVQTSLETLIYSRLMDKFKNTEIEFYLPQSTFSYFSVFGQKLRFFHGHQIKYAGGVGGITIPLYKKIMRLDQTMPAFHNFMGHYHTLSMPTPHCTLNGSLIGYNAFALYHGFTYEKPMQSYQLMHPKYGMTAFHKIICEWRSL